MKRYLRHSIENMRDIGGYNRLPYRKLIRSNLPKNLSAQDIDYLKQMKITTIIDLRSEEEYTSRISCFENRKDFNLVHCPFVIGRDIPATPEDVPISYLKMLEDKENMCNIFTTIMNANGGLIYFCNAGKDRTGVITALLLMFLNYPHKKIIEDYMMTKIYLHNILINFIASSNRPIADIIIPNMYFMKKFLVDFRKKYGSITSYLNGIGFDKSLQRKIRNKLIK